jgi:PAS domain S-box-containing protein
MLLRELKELVRSTADAAFAIDHTGEIIAWNAAAETLFGLAASEAIGSFCGAILHGADECGPVCHERCSIKQSVQAHHQPGNFDLQAQTAAGRKWLNVSVLAAELNGSTQRVSIHIIREVDRSRRLEMLVRDFVQTEASPARMNDAVTRSPVRAADLTRRELEILRLMAKGLTTEKIAGQLSLSRATVNNHIQHVLQKLNAHSRLEAIRRAEHAGLI